MLDLFIDFATVINLMGLPAYLFLMLAERRLGLPPMLSVCLMLFCIFGGLNHAFQAYALYQADHVDYKDLNTDDKVALVWITCMVLKSLTLNVVAAAAWVYGANLRDKAKKLHRRTKAMESNDGR